MSDTRLKSRHQRRSEHPPPPPHRRRSWCCSFAVPPHSPDNPTSVHSSSKNPSSQKNELPFLGKSSISFPNSPQSQGSSKPNSLVVVTRIGPRRILSPGRVSPIDSLDETLLAPNPTLRGRGHSPSASIEIAKSPMPRECEVSSDDNAVREGGNLGIFDVRLNLKGKNGGGSLVLELSSQVLTANTLVFADLIADFRKKSKGLCRIEVPDVDNLGIFRETIELMFEEDIPKRLLKIGVYRTIDVLEVSASIKFTRGILSCLEYIEAMPWTEEEEEKLRNVFAKVKFDDETISRDIVARLYTQDSLDSQQKLARNLVLSVTTCNDANARNELKPLVKGLLCKNSFYEKECPDLNTEDIFAIFRSCLGSLVTLLEEATSTNPSRKLAKEKDKPLIERISNQVDNINWLLEILLDHQMAEGLVDMWTHQVKLLHLHKCASPMLRYELSRVSAKLFIAMGTRKMHCRSETRLGLMQAWFKPMLLDFGWLQRCKKGLDIKALEEAMGQALLTLPLKEQYMLFMDWFRYFSKNGTECPNLSKAFQIWWRRSFLRGSDPYAVESRDGNQPIAISNRLEKVNGQLPSPVDWRWRLVSRYLCGGEGNQTGYLLLPWEITISLVPISNVGDSD
nr:BTB/POZ domain-containing protein At2g13690 [Ipomoea batatas]